MDENHEIICQGQRHRNFPRRNQTDHFFHLNSSQIRYLWRTSKLIEIVFSFLLSSPRWILSLLNLIIFALLWTKIAQWKGQVTSKCTHSIIRTNGRRSLTNEPANLFRSEIGGFIWLFYKTWRFKVFPQKDEKKQISIERHLSGLQLGLQLFMLESG